MTTLSTNPAMLRSQANHEFFVRNWSERLQRASQLERQLLGLMLHPCYRLTVALDDQGIERLHVKPSPGKPSPLTDAAREHIRTHRSELIAWVKRTDADRARLKEALV